MYRSIICQFLTDPASFPMALLSELEQIHAHAYAEFAPWPAGKFVEKLASYGNVALARDTFSQEVKCFIVYGYPVKLEHQEYIKIGPLGFALDVNSARQKVHLLRDVLPAWLAHFSQSILWAELPLQTTAIGKLLVQHGYTTCDDIGVTRSLLKIAGVFPTSIQRENDIVWYEVASKGYAQKVMLRYPRGGIMTVPFEERWVPCGPGPSPDCTQPVSEWEILR